MAEPSIKSPSVNPVLRFLSLCWLRVRSLLLRRRIRTPQLEIIGDYYFLVLPQVQNPVVFRSGRFFAEVLMNTDLVKPHPGMPDPRALDMGTGCGVGAVVAAGLGYRVTGVDLNPVAVRCATANAVLNGLESRIDNRHGDLFMPVGDERFGLVLFNPPFYRGEPQGEFDLSWRSRDVFERFADGLGRVLLPDGRAMVLLSTDGEPAVMLHALDGKGFQVSVVQQRNFGNEIMTVYQVLQPQSGS